MRTDRTLHGWIKKFRQAKDRYERQEIVDQFHTWLTVSDELTIGEADALLTAINQKGYVS